MLFRRGFDAMKLRGGKWQAQGNYIEVRVTNWRGRVRKRLLPREGWEELEPGFWMLSATRLWIRPLFLLRKSGELRAYEGKDAAEAARGEGKMKSV